MGSVCTENHHHHHMNHHIPPRKLLTRPSEAAALMQKYLPYNGSDSDSDMDSDPYSSDQFRMYEFKVRKCTRSRSHDWTDCPFAHPGEKARRRDPRRFHYSGTVCPEYRRSGSCSRGDECEFAHGVFECWLHPGRYRTEACKDGKNCKRKICFFAHSPRQLRLLPPNEDEEERDGKTERTCLAAQHCCRHCCSFSPTSALIGMSQFSPPMSPSRSPPRSPMKAAGLTGLSPVSRYSDRACGSTGNNSLSYEDMVIADLLGSMEGMSLSGLKPNKPPGLWVDVGGYDDHHYQFNLSPSTSRTSYGSTVIDHHDRSKGFNEVAIGGLPGPDLGWVNDLLM